MVLDVGLVLEQHQRLHHEALDQLGSPVLTQRQDLLVGEQVSGSVRVAQPVSQRVLERMRPKQFAYDGITSEIHRRVQASSGADRFRSSLRVAIPIGSRRPCGAPLCMLFVIVFPSCPVSGSTPKRTRREPARSIRSGRGNRGAGVTPVGRPDHPRSQNPAVPASRLARTRDRSVASGLASLRRAFWPQGPARHRLYSSRIAGARQKPTRPPKTCRFARKSALGALRSS